MYSTLERPPCLRCPLVDIPGPGSEAHWSMPKSTHETVSFATFLEYRALRMRAPVSGPVPPDVVTDPPVRPELEAAAVAAEVPRVHRV